METTTKTFSTAGMDKEDSVFESENSRGSFHCVLYNVAPDSTREQSKYVKH
jgi:hypothetical protein